MLFLWENTFHSRQPERNLATQTHGPCSYCKLPRELWELNTLNSGHSPSPKRAARTRAFSVPGPVAAQRALGPVWGAHKSIKQRLKNWGVTGYANPPCTRFLLETRRSHPTSDYNISICPQDWFTDQGFSEPFPERVASRWSKEAGQFWTLFGDFNLVLIMQAFWTPRSQKICKFLKDGKFRFIFTTQAPSTIPES